METQCSKFQANGTVYTPVVHYQTCSPSMFQGKPVWRRQILTLGGLRKKNKKMKEKKRKRKEKRRFSQWSMWRINISFFTTFGVFCWLDLKFKGCFVFKYFSPRRNYVLNIPNCSISHDFFWGSRTFSFYGSLVHKNLNFLWPQEFWELPKGCHSLLE